MFTLIHVYELSLKGTDMLKTVNRCVDCTIPCVGGFCRTADSYEVCCDSCGQTAERFYLLDGENLCRQCFIEAALENADSISAEELLYY